MKTILIPTDFSDSARNASFYGVQLAKFTKSKILLFHSYHIPVPATEIPIMVSYEGLEEESLKMLENEKKKIDPQNELDIECVALAGFAVDNIIEVETLRKPDIIIMGMRGVSKLSEYLLGSITTAFISRTASPVIVVPEKAVFRLPNRIAFACDYTLDPSKGVLDPLKKFVELFHSEIQILNFMKRKDLVSSEKSQSGMLIENYFDDFTHNYYFEEDQDFVHGIIHFVDEHHTDLIALVPHEHSLFQNLFKESHTKKLAFHTTIPLLTIPERKNPI